MNTCMDKFAQVIQDIETYKTDVTKLKADVVQLSTDVSVLKQTQENNTTTLSDAHEREVWAAELKERRRREKTC